MTFTWTWRPTWNFLIIFIGGFGCLGFKSRSGEWRPCAVFVVFLVYVVKCHDITWNYPTPFAYTYFPNLCCQLSCIIRYPILQVCLYYQLLCSWSRVFKASLNKPRVGILFGNWEGEGREWLSNSHFCYETLERFHYLNNPLKGEADLNWVSWYLAQKKH
jgi:hypothetical protein